MNEKEYIERFNLLAQYQDENEYIEELVKLIRTIHYERTNFVKNSDNDGARDEFFNFLKQEIIEVYKTYKEYSNSTNEIYKDIEFVGCGRTTVAIRIGDNVLKVGKSRTKNNIYEYQCLIPVYYSYDQEITSDEYYSIQLNPLVDTKNITDEDTYEAYRKLRKLGYIWNDPAPKNVGRIIRTMNYLDNVYEEGEIVIIDLEDFCYVGEITPEEVIDELAFENYNQKAYVYEMRYIEEQKNNTPHK